MINNLPAQGKLRFLALQIFILSAGALLEVLDCFFRIGLQGYPGSPDMRKMILPVQIHENVRS